MLSQCPQSGFPLKTLDSLNKESRPLFLGDKAFGVLFLFLLFAITAFAGPEGYFCLAIIAFGALSSLSPTTSIV